MQITCCGFSGVLLSNDATDVYDEGNCAMVPHEVHIAEFDLGSFSMAFPHLEQYSDLNKPNLTQLKSRYCICFCNVLPDDLPDKWLPCLAACSWHRG